MPDKYVNCLTALFSFILLKNVALSLSSNIMLSNRIAAALLAIVVASSFITVSDFVGSASAYTAKKVTHHEYGVTLPLPFSGLPAVLEMIMNLFVMQRCNDTWL